VVDFIREEIGRDLRRKAGAGLLKPAFQAARRRSDPAEVGGAPLLGLTGCCVIGHGHSTPRAVMHGIRAAAEFHSSGVNAAIEAELADLGARKEAAGA
jgi:glycerol-3-phosphate acyltransferase PlsX